MKTIVAEILKRIKSAENAIERDEKILQYFAEVFGECVKQAFEAIDEEVSNQHKEQGYRVERRDSRSIQYLFGDVTFKRRRMKRADAKGIYPFDREMGLGKHQRYSTLLMRNVAELATKTVYRVTAQAVNLLTPIQMSHQKVANLLHAVGKQCKNWKEEQVAQEMPAKEPCKQVEFLYIEGDGLTLKGQKKRKLEIHRIQIAEGVEKSGNRTKLVHPHYISGINRKEVVETATAYLVKHYDVSHTKIISNSDGGAGYEYKVFADIADGCMQHEHFLDRYHVNRKIKERLNFIPVLQHPLQKALREYDWEKVITVLDTAESMAEDESLVDQVVRLRGYMKRNWNYLKPAEQRGIENKQEAIGTCESNHRIYSYRMKRQGRYWGKDGAEAMVQVIDALRNDELDQALTQQVKGYAKKKSRRFSGAVKEALKKSNAAVHIGVKRGRIVVNGPTSGAMGRLAKLLG